MLARVRHRTLARHLAIVAVVALALYLTSLAFDPFNDTRLATGAYLFAALAGLTVLTGLNGQISLGHGALMAVGAYATALLIGNEHWPLAAALAVAVVVTALAGMAVGAAAARLRGPYLAGATLAFAIGLPGLADRFPGTFGGENGLTVSPPTPPSSLGSSFPLERWQAWIAGLGALLVLFVLMNLRSSAIGRTLRAVRDDEIAASLCGIGVGRTQVLAFVVSAACAGVGGGMFVVVQNLAAPGAFALSLSLSLLTGVVLGGLGSLAGAAWGAAALVMLPSWSDDIARNLSLSTNVSENLPLAIYGVVLIVFMIAAPRGIQGLLEALARRGLAARGQRANSNAAEPVGPPTTSKEGETR